jgi:hypothetical protein
MALSGVDSGHHNHPTLGQLTSSCGDFLNKESVAITQVAWRPVNIKISKKLQTLNKNSSKIAKKKKTTTILKNGFLQTWEGKISNKCS